MALKAGTKVRMISEELKGFEDDFDAEHAQNIISDKKYNPKQWRLVDDSPFEIQDGKIVERASGSTTPSPKVRIGQSAGSTPA